MNCRKSIFLSIIGIIVVAIYLFPVYWMVNSSLKTNGEIFSMPPTFYPQKMTFAPYVEQINNILLYFFNSFSISIFSMLITLVLAVPAAYGMARFKIKGRAIFLFTFLITQMLPGAVLLTPLFIIFKVIGILNMHLAPILANATVSIPFSVLTLRPYFLGIPYELEDSAKIDGCNKLTTFLRIIVPVSYPGILVTAIFAFLMSWGNLIFPLTFLTDENKWPMTVTIYRAIGQYGTRWNSLMAYATVVTIPVIIMFIFAQKYLVSGLTAGALKE